MSIDSAPVSEHQSHEQNQIEFEPSEYDNMDYRELTFDDALTIIKKGYSYEGLAQNEKLIVEMVDEEGCSLLHHAAEDGKLVYCQMLVAKGAQIGLRNNRGENPAHMAMSNGHTECSISLLSEMGEKRVESPWIF